MAEKLNGGPVKNYPCLGNDTLRMEVSQLKSDQIPVRTNKPTIDEVSQLLRDCMRTFNNLNIDSGTLIDRIKAAIKGFSDEMEDQENRLRQSDKKAQAWEDFREGAFNSWKKQQEDKLKS